MNRSKLSRLWWGLMLTASLGPNWCDAQPIPSLDAVRIASGLSSALFVTAPPGDYSRIFVVRQSGQIHIINLADLAAGNATPTLFLDISSGHNLQAGGEQGLLGLAFDPNFSTVGHPGQGKFYLYFTVTGGTWNNGVTHVSQFQVDPSDPTGNTALGTEHLLTMPQPSPSPAVPLTFSHPQPNHNAGWIGFSPRPGDDYNLYISTGDGGNGYDQDPNPTPTPPGHIEPGGNAQNKTTLLGKMLRVHVNPADATYSIPPNNPFINVAGVRPEIWAYGLRNPFRDSFDRANGRMFIADVGQDTREEVDVQQPTNPGGGENYGWRLREGTIATPKAGIGGSPPPDNVEPIIDYDHNTLGGGTVIGGYVYRGRQIPGLTGTYVFGDYVLKKIFTLNYNGTTASNFTDITSQLFPTATADSLNSLSSFGEDANGELYISDVGSGKIFKIVPVAPYVTIDSLTKDANNAMLHGFGVPFKNHTVQAIDSMTQQFNAQSVIGTATAGGDGSLSFTDSTLGNSTARFYRVTFP